MTGLPAVLVTGAVLAALGPPGRCPEHWCRGVGRERAEARSLVAAGSAAGSPAGSAGASAAGSAGASPAGSLLGAVTAVASALRSGQPPASAWRSVLGCPVGPDGVPGLEDLLEATVRGSSGARAVLFRVLHGHAPPGLVARSGATSHQLATLARRATAVVAGGRLATTLGAPLAPVLDRVAESIVADDEVDGERRAALAGPRSTAAVLGWLPLLGVALGIALGADPLGVVLRGGIGTASAVVGCGLLVAGRWWTSRLVNRAALVGRS